MSGPQFVHLQSYSRKTNSGGQSIQQILAEAARSGDYLGHVPNPKPPNLIFGVGPEQVAAKHDKMVEEGFVEVKLATGSVARRGIRKDRHTLMTVVASYPLLTEQVAIGSKGRRDYDDWIQLNIKWLKQMFGDRLISVIEHVDEKHPHLHAFILPIGDPTCSSRDLNPAWKVKEEVEALAKANNHPAKIAVRMGNAAYKAKAREIQDDYHRSVGELAGLTRTGPKRARLSRAQWKAEKEDARRKAELLNEMNNRVQVIADAEIHLDAEADRIAEEISVKLELAEEILDNARRVQVEADHTATARIAEAELEAQELSRKVRNELSNQRDAVAAEVQRASYSSASLEVEREQLIRKTFADCVVVTVRVLLGIFAGTVRLSANGDRIQIDDLPLEKAVERLDLGELLRDVVAVVGSVWGRLSSKLSPPEVKIEQQRVEKSLKPLTQPPQTGMKP